MIPILYNSTETDFTKNGIGWLKDCTKCTVTEELNGIFECEFSYPITGNFYKEIVPDRIIKVKPNETATPQLFKIYRTSKPINGIVKIYCQHISYDLNGNPVVPFTHSTTNATTILNAILDHCYYAHRFTAVSYSNTRSKFDLKIPVSARKCLGGMEGSILDNFKGEFEFDNFTIRHYKSRGQDNGVTIRYGKNLTDITADTSIADVYTSVYPYATDEDGDYYELPEKVIELPSRANYGEPRTLPLDLSDKFDSETRITSELLRQYANAYISSNKIDEIKQNIKVSFVQLWQSKEYETISLLERVKLGDIVTVKYPALGVSVKAKVIKTVYDVLAEKYTEIELGQAKSNFASTLNKVNSELKTMSDFMRTQPSLMEKAIENATGLITGQTGGYVVLNQDKNTGKNNEILIMNQPTIEAATQLWRWNLGGLGYSSGTNAYNGQYRTAITMDGAINADFITAGTLNADLIRTGTIRDVQNNTSINLTNGKIDVALGSYVLEIWTQGITMYNSQDEVLTSMFVSINGNGVLTANTALVGARDSEKVRIDGISGKLELIDTSTVNHTVKGKFYLSASNKSVLQTDFVNVDGIQINKNSNGRLAVNQPIVSNFSIEDSNGNEIGSFYESVSGKSILNADNVYSDEISAKTNGSKVQITNLSSEIISLVTNGNEVGSFYVNVNGQSYLRTDTLQLGNYQYAERSITVDGVTYNVLARV